MATARLTVDARRAFLGGLIDDAALFPPARLSMAAAVASHIAHRQGAHAWIQGTFVCPASRLDEMAGLLPANASEWAVSVIADGDDLAADVHAALRVRDLTDGRAWGHAIETRLRTGEAESISAAVSVVRKATEAVGVTLTLALELPVTGAAADDINGWLRAIRQLRSPGTPALVAKLRCGGLSADAFPSVAQTAAVVRGCVEHDVPLKATAGLHHPVRHWDPATGFDHHGFFNLFGALVLLGAGAIEDEQLTAVLEETDPAAFTLTAEGFGWRDAVIDEHAVRAQRGRLVVGYGSCSFDEPVDDLVALGVLAEPAR